MRFFTPTIDPWGGGLQALADAITQAPANRAKIRQMELDAANAAADNARAEAALKLQQEKAAREAQLHPLTMQDTELGIEQKSLANEFSTANNPILLRKNTADAGKAEIELANADTARQLELARIGQLPGTAGSLADTVYDRVHAKMPEWDLSASLDVPALPQEPDDNAPGAYRLPPVITGVDYPGMAGPTVGMDEISRRMDVRDRIGTLADTAVLSDPKMDQAKWIDDTAEAFVGETAGGYRPATPAEKAAFGVKPETPLVIDPEGKPTILSDGKTTIDLSGGTNKQVFDETKARADVARAATVGLAALDNAEANLEGAITGAGANQRLALQKIAAYMGVGDTSSITDTETFRSAVQPIVSAVLRGTVGSSQISNADREFAEKAAAGDITLDASSIRRLFSIMRAANSTLVRDFNRDLDVIYPEGQGFDRERALFQQPEVAKFYPSPIGPRQPEYQPPGALPDEAVQDLLADPSPAAIAEFDEVFGPGATAKVLGGRN